MHDILVALKQLFQAKVNLGSGEFAKIKSIRYGKPLKIEESSMPAIAINPIETLYPTTGTKTSKRQCVVEATLIFNGKDYYKIAKDDAFKLYAVEAGIDMAESVTDNQGIDGNSLVGVIMSNIRLPFTVGAQTKNACDFCLIETVRYELRPEGNFPTYEIVVRMKATLLGDRK